MFWTLIQVHVEECYNCICWDSRLIHLLPAALFPSTPQTTGDNKRDELRPPRHLGFALEGGGLWDLQCPPSHGHRPGSDHPARGRSCRAAPLLLKTHACPRGFWAPPTHCCPAPHPSSRVSVIKRSEEALANTEWGGGWTSLTKHSFIFWFW